MAAGWFQSSLLTSVAANGHAPYKQVGWGGWAAGCLTQCVPLSLNPTLAATAASCALLFHHMIV